MCTVLNSKTEYFVLTYTTASESASERKRTAMQLYIQIHSVQPADGLYTNSDVVVHWVWVAVVKGWSRSHHREEIGEESRGTRRIGGAGRGTWKGHQIVARTFMCPCPRTFLTAFHSRG